MMGKDDKRIKCVAVGQEGVGKTCLLTTYAKQEYPEEYHPTVVDVYHTEQKVNGKIYAIELLDTSGLDEHDSIRPLGYPDADVFLVCYSIGSLASLEHVTKKWVPEVRTHNPRVPVILVGTKADLRDEIEDEEESDLVEDKEAAKIVNALSLYSHVECSAQALSGVNELFDLAIKAALETKNSYKKEKGKCLLL
ncbi:ras-like GTP-binding protein RHO [Ischnura elegans]|uniref:ras-like GTP-binding protein RHO n=1 Tax=Ischnura elegans TaxID=197161 RepID=UPI001ED87770|nr:ras-like GTP-binding protein RHO [Ischnura elegans]